MDAHVVMDPNGGTTWGHAKTSQSTSAAPSSYGGVHDPEGQETTPTDVFALAASMQQIRTATWSATPTPVQREQPMPAPAQRFELLGQMFAPIRACFSGNCERGSGGGKGGNSRSRGAGKGGRSATTHAAAQPHPLSTSERSTGSSSTQFGSHASVSSCPMQPSCSNPQQHPMAFSAHPFSPPPMTMFHGHGLPPPQPPPPPPRQLPSSQLLSLQLSPTESLFQMGFDPEDVGRALVQTRGDVVRALELLQAAAKPADAPKPKPPAKKQSTPSHSLVAASRPALSFEGFELVPSSKNKTGFKGVTQKKDRYAVHTWENGKACQLAVFDTPEEAALCYSRHIGAERAAAEAAAARRPVFIPRTEFAIVAESLSDQDGAGIVSPWVAAAAAAEGLTLIRSGRTTTGFKHVTQNMPTGTHAKPFQLRVSVEGKVINGGYYATADEAALAYARRIGPAASAREAKRDEWLTPAQVLAIAEAEGLVLERSNNVTGFRFVSYDPKGYGSHRPFRLQIKGVGRKYATLATGTFHTAEAAALEAARYFASRNTSEKIADEPPAVSAEEEKARERALALAV